MTCKDCLCFDADHYWCLMGSKRIPSAPACEYFVEIPDGDCSECKIGEE